MPKPYRPEWKTGFERLKEFLTSELAGFAPDIQHVGSTAIPGLMAKPVLDIDIIIDSKPLLDPVAAKLIALGYLYKGEQGIPGRFAFRQVAPHTPGTAASGAWQAHHLYVCFSDSLALKNHLRFRDALLKDKDLAARYGQLKAALAADPGITKAAYTRRKTDFILSVLAQAGLEPHELEQIKEANA